MSVHRFGRAGGWGSLVALALCCACGSSRTLPAANGGTAGNAGPTGESGKAGAASSAGTASSAGHSGSGGSAGAARGGGSGSKAGSGGSSGRGGSSGHGAVCDAGCSGRDGSVQGGEWPDAGCTFGQNQTCNDDPAMSAYAGMCSNSGTCSCMPGFAIRLATGKCAAYTPQSGDPCQRNGGCNDNPVSSARAGLCLNDGSCYCLGTAVKNPDTGLCKLP